MKTRISEAGGRKIAICESETAVIVDGQSALDFLVNIGYAHDCRHVALNKAALGEDFFRLSTGVAGEVAQKIVNYGFCLAVVGDFSGYTSKSLQDYMHECNRGRHLFFVNDESEALNKLSSR